MFEWLRYFELHRDFTHSWATHLIDMVVVFIIIYEILTLVKDTRAVQMAAGIGVVAALYLVSRALHLETLLFLMRNMTVYVGFGIIVLFQSEIRAALTHFGKNLRNPFSFRSNRDKKPIDSFDEIILATTTFSAQKIGALIVLERTVGLQNYINRGVRMDAILSYDLLVNIFNTNAPLHDGAVIIRNRRIAAASCFLPLTLNPRLSKELGTRHRAAIGITEECDALVIVVSEETGVISIVEQGQITRNLDSRKLRLTLSRAMDLSQVPSAPRRYRRRSFTTDISISPDSISDASTETPVSGTPVLAATGAPAKRIRETGSLNFGAFFHPGMSLGNRLSGLFREYIFKNGKLKIIAGILTLALWAAVTSQQEAVSYTVRGVQITYQGLSSKLRITNRDSVEVVTVRVRGPHDIVERLRPESFSINVPLGGKDAGDCVVRLKESNGDAVIEKPDSIEILEIVPPHLTVKLEHLVERQIEIKPSFKGDLPVDYQLTGFTVFPALTTLLGPEGRINELQNVGTETIWINTRQASFKEKYKIVVDPQTEVLSPSSQEVVVNVNIQPILATRQFTEVTIRPSPFLEPIPFFPKTAIVEIEGPKSIVEKLSSADISLIFKPADPATPNQLPLHCTIPRLGPNVTIKAINPPFVQRSRN